MTNNLLTLIHSIHFQEEIADAKEGGNTEDSINCNDYRAKWYYPHKQDLKCKDYRAN